MSISVEIIGITSLSVATCTIPANQILTKLSLPRWYLLALFIPICGSIIFIYLAGFTSNPLKMRLKMVS